jgi:prepilin-type N-terminal cleavage/methylation domain-containing protein
VRRRTPLRRSEGKGARKSDGFTLVEVIVVLVILAILAAIAIPALTGYIDKANTSQIKAKARSAAVAMQTILSEAYADPQTRLLPYDAAGFTGPPSGDLYVGGKLIGGLMQPGTTRGIDNADTMYAVNGIESNFVDLFRKLDPSAITLDESTDQPSISMMYILLDKHCSLIAYAYIDPESRKDMTDVRVCTYNYYVLDEFLYGTPKVRYDSTAGLNLWSVDIPAQGVTPIG